jgi:hypothetical protein
MSILNKILDWMTAHVLAWFPNADPSLVRVGVIVSMAFTPLLLLAGATGWAISGQLTPLTPSTATSQLASSAPVAAQQGPSVPGWPQQYIPGP